MNWNWLLHTDAGLLARIAVGATIFLVLAMFDLIQRGRHATRWREYLFLLVCAGAAMAYGVVNDRIALAASWEYFYFGKGLDQQLGPKVPPDREALQREVDKIGMRATWSVGLVIGVALLLANNPRKDRRQLPYWMLLKSVVGVFVVTACCASIGAWLGARGALNWTSADVSALWRQDLFRPASFSRAYGMNLGGYAGGMLGTVLATISVVKRRQCWAEPSGVVSR